MLSISSLSFAQVPQQVKYVEIISELADTMALINKEDIDVLNTVFYQNERLDTLNIVNTQIIENLESSINELNVVVYDQSEIIFNHRKIQKHLEESYEDAKQIYKDELKTAHRKTVFWETTTGISVVVIIILAIL